MKKVFSSLALFAAVEVLLWMIVSMALGQTISQMLEQKLLGGVVFGFGFLIAVLAGLLVRFLELPEVAQTKGTRWMLSFLFPVAIALLLAVLIYVVREISEMVVAIAIFCCVLVIANVAILYLLRTMERQAKEERERALLRQQMEIQFRVNGLSALRLETDALVVLFSNLLDNAIEGCQKLERGRTIECSILSSDSLYISIRNTSLPVVIHGNEIPTTKEPKQEHGFGLVSVRRILDDLGAEYTFHYADI